MKKTKQHYRFFCIILTMCLLFSMTSTHGFDIKVYAEENAAQDISASDFTFSAEMDYGEMKTINLELETAGEDGTQKNILRVPENFLQSDIRISAKSENTPAFSVSYTQYKAKGKTNKINEKSESGTLLTGRNWWSRYNPTDSYPELELTVQDKKIKVEIRPYAALSQIKATDERKNDRPLKESCQVKDAGNNSYLIPLQYSDTQNAYEITAVKGSKLIITPVTHREATYEIKDKAGATLSTNTSYTYQAGEQDSEITIEANSAKGFDSKQYKLIIHSLEKDYFPNLQYTVKENDTTLDIGDGTFLNDAWNYNIELKQDATCSITVLDQTNESQLTYYWSHRINYQEQKLNDSSSNSVTVNTRDFASLGNSYDLRAVRIVDDYTYAVNVKFSYTLNHITHINAPQITSQPTSANYQIGESAKRLSISASALAGTVKYQWYKNSANDTETGVPIEDAIQRSYQPEVSDNFTGTTYYYCKAKAVYKGADDKEIVSEETVSTVAAITVAPGSFPWKGKGTEAEPYLLTNTESITQLRDYVNKGISMENICFKMTQDISLPKNWTPIGCTADGTTDIKKGANLWAFSGTIDGDNKTLTVPKGEKPLLGYVKGAAVKNLVIYGEEINGYGLVNNFEGVGLEGSAIIVDKVTLKRGTKTLKSGILGAIPTTNGFAGVSAGFTAIIRNCTVEEGVVIGYDGKQNKIGSIAGRMQGVIENCTSKATVQGINDVGGIVGARDNALGTCTVKNCKFSGDVEASGDNAGGIAGGVYSNSTAPNGVKMTIQACTVDGKIQGMKNVGGILGAELYVAQAWDAYAFIGNFFSGTIQGKENIGGIIGYYNSLNKIDHVAANFYTTNCGASEGIGMVKYVDTSYKTPTKFKETIYFNTEKGTGTVPNVEGCHWKARYNRADDPLGADKEKLTKAVDSMPQEAICYELILKDGSVKSDYYLGDDFNFGNAKFTAMWTDGKETEVDTKDITIDGYNKNKHSIQTVTLSYGYGQLSVQVAVKQKESGNPTKDTLTVSFTLLGDSKHNEANQEGGPHGLALNKLDTWLDTKSYEVPLNSTVWDLMKQVQKANNNITFNARGSQYGTYVYSVTYNGTELGELDNGKLSGWMYTVNGTHPEVGVASRFLNNGDTVVFHYTDDYTKEEGSEKWNTPGGAVEEVKDVTTDTKTGTTTAPTDVKVSEKTNADGTKTKVADVKVSADNQKEILKQAKQSKANEIILVVSSKSVGDAEKADVTLDKSFIDSIVKDTDAKLTIRTPFGDKTYTQDELKAMSEAANGSTVTVAIEKVAEEPTDDAAVKMEKAKSIVKDLKLVARSSKTAKKNIKAVLKSDAKTKDSVQELKDLGFTVKYRFYRSTKKAAAYKAAVTKKTASYTNTGGKKGTKYFYKVQVRVYDENGKLIAKTALKQCKYATRTWSKAK